MENKKTLLLSQVAGGSDLIRPHLHTQSQLLVWSHSLLQTSAPFMKYNE